MKGFAHAHVRGIFERLPMVIWWLVKHHVVIPTHAWEILDRAGLLIQKNGRPVRHEYEMAHELPYGSIQRNLMS